MELERAGEDAFIVRRLVSDDLGAGKSGEKRPDETYVRCRA